MGAPAYRLGLEVSGPPADRIRVLWLIKGLGPGGAEQLLVNHAEVRDADRFDIEAAYLVPWKNHLVPRLEAVGVTDRVLRRQPGVGSAVGAPAPTPTGRPTG